MAIAPQLVKKRFENLSVEELETKYNELKRHYCFDSKEQQIGYVIENYLNASLTTNMNSTKIALEELLKEKTGKDYNINPERFKITLLDVINYITSPNDDPFWTTTLANYFQQLNDISEDEKLKFLIEIVQDKDTFNEFTKEIIKNQSVNETYNKYREIVKKYIAMNMRIG